MSAYAVGQTVLWIPPYGDRTPKEVTVTKVGRVRVTVTHRNSGEQQYRIDTGHGVKDFTGRIVAVEQYAEEKRLEVVLAALRKEFGLTITRGLCLGIPAVTWERVQSLLLEARDGEDQA